MASREANRAYYEHNAGQERSRALAYHADNRDARLAKMHAYHRSMRGLFCRGQLHAKRHGHVWTITEQQFAALRARSCHYCDGPLPETGHGLDRIDCTGGYEPDNVLPCCQSCNRKRSNDWTVEETRIAVQAVLSHRRSNG